MEQDEKKEEQIGIPYFRVVWHKETQSDFSKINSDIAEKIIENTNHKLSRAPLYIGEPLKGTSNRLWKVSYSKYRIVYTINQSAKEVIILSVQKREIVYKKNHIINLLNLAIALQEEAKQNKPPQKK